MISKLNIISIGDANSKKVEIDIQEKSHFCLLFLKNDESLGVKAMETMELDFENIKEHLKSGDSVFISYKNRKQLPLEQFKNKTKKREFLFKI